MSVMSSLLGKRDFKTVLVTGTVRKGKTFLLQEFLNKHKNLNLSVFLISPKSETLDTKGYVKKEPYGHMGQTVNILLVETEKHISDLDFTRLLNTYDREVENIVIFTCLSSNDLDAKVIETFDTVIDLNKESVEDACKRI